MSNSRVESHSRAELRNKIISAATLLEILLSGLVLIGLLLSMIPLLQWMPGLLFDGNDVEVSTFLQRALDIVIGIEFHEELEDLIVDIVHALVRLIDLVDRNDDLNTCCFCMVDCLYGLWHYTIVCCND